MKKAYKDIELPYGRKLVNLKIPNNNIIDILYPNVLPGVRDEKLEIEKALENPINSEKLSVLARGKKNAVILASDITRPVPTHKLLPPLIEELNKAGISNDEITVIFGLGYHRGHTESEMRKLIGEELSTRIKFMNHDVDNCKFVGTTSHGTPVEIFKPVLDSDFVIGTGNIELHYIAGYSGGNKALMPGVCSKNTIQTNHKMLLNPNAATGKIDGNPLRDDIEEVGKMGRVQFIFNVVLNSKKEIVKAVAGHPVDAHRAGISTIDSMFKRNIGEAADIVIASCGGYPKDINLYQSQKALDNSKYAVRDGGRIILVAECIDGIGGEIFEEWMNRANSVDAPVKWIQEEFVLGGHKAAVICSVLQKVPSYLISSIDEDSTKSLFFKYAKTPQAALDEALQELGADSRILILPYASATLPYIV